MAYLDNNNDNLYSKSDPLDELDRELAELRKTLGELEGDTPQPIEDKPDDPEKRPPVSRTRSIPSAEKADSGQESRDELPEHEKPDNDTEQWDRQTKSRLDDDFGGEEAKPESKSRYERPAERPAPKKRSKLPLVITITALAAALVLVIGLAARKYLPFGTAEIPDEEESKTVTISDSVMGDIEIQPVEGAETNPYTKEGLVKDENGVPEYYENDRKISHLGVDISEFQGDVDFQAMKEAGVEFVMLRIGGRFYGDKSSIYGDDKFDDYYEQANDAGLKVGAYFFSQAISAEDAREEANYAITTLNGRKLSYPIAFDWENIEGDEARTDNINGDQLTAIAGAFCDTVNEAGYKSIVYSNASQMFVMYDFETMKDYDFWLADYREFPTMYYKFDMWQYTKEGTIDGIEGSVDLNLSFTDFSE